MLDSDTGAVAEANGDWHALLVFVTNCVPAFMGHLYHEKNKSSALFLLELLNIDIKLWREKKKSF